MEELPYKICFDDTLGRHLVATKPIEIGAVVLQEAPLIKGPFFHTFPVCLGCGKILGDGDSRPCGKCGWPVCNDDCENSKNHEPECVLTAARGNKMSIKNFGIPNPNYQFVSILRALYLKMNSPELWEQLMRLQSHPIDVDLAPPSFVKKLFKLDNWSEDEIIKVCEILSVNGHELPLTQAFQLVVYYDISFFEHSCLANCNKTFTAEGEVLVVAGTEIQAGDHLSICYTEPLWGVENRRRHLYETKKFWCTCCRCQDPLEMDTHLNSIKRPNSCEGYVLPKSFLQDTPTIWSCDSCDKIFSHDNISSLISKIGEEMMQMPKDDVSVCKKFIKNYENILASTHFYMIDVKMALSLMFSSGNFKELSDNDLKLLLKTTEELKWVAEKIAPAERRLLGLILYRLAKTKFEISCRENDPVKLRAVLLGIKNEFSHACALLSHEPCLLPEGRLRLQIGVELQLIENLLNSK